MSSLAAASTQAPVSLRAGRLEVTHRPRFARALSAAALGAALLCSSSSRADDAVPASAAESDRLAQLEREVQELKTSASRPRFPVRFGAFLHADWVIHRESSQDEINASTKEPLNEDRFVLRRARPQVSVDTRHIESTVMLDVNTVRGPTVRPALAEVTAKLPSTEPHAPPLLAASMGMIRSPFGFEPQQAARDRLFLERSNVSRGLFSASFDLGLRFAGAFRFLRYSTAIMNGEPLGTTGFPTRDPNKNKDLVSRVGVDTEIAHGVQLQAGASLLTGRGFHAGTPATKDSLVWRDENENGLVELTELQAVPGKARTPSEGFRRFGLGADARITARIPGVGPLRAAFEIMKAQNLDRGLLVSDPVAMGRDLRQLGYYVQVSQDVGRYFAAGVRYDTYNADSDAQEQSVSNLVSVDRSFSTWSFTVAAMYAPGRLVLQYDRNRNPFGRTLSGAPTSLADDALTLRAEAAF